MNFYMHSPYAVSDTYKWQLLVFTEHLLHTRLQVGGSHSATAYPLNKSISPILPISSERLIHPILSIYISAPQPKIQNAVPPGPLPIFLRSQLSCHTFRDILLTSPTQPIPLLYTFTIPGTYLVGLYQSGQARLCCSNKQAPVSVVDQRLFLSCATGSLWDNGRWGVGLSSWSLWDPGLAEASSWHMLLHSPKQWKGMGQWCPGF